MHEELNAHTHINTVLNTCKIKSNSNKWYTYVCECVCVCTCVGGYECLGIVQHFCHLFDVCQCTYCPSPLKPMSLTLFSMPAFCFALLCGKIFSVLYEIFVVFGFALRLRSFVFASVTHTHTHTLTSAKLLLLTFVLLSFAYFCHFSFHLFHASCSSSICKSAAPMFAKHQSVEGAMWISVAVRKNRMTLTSNARVCVCECALHIYTHTNATVCGSSYLLFGLCS